MARTRSGTSCGIRTKASIFAVAMSRAEMLVGLPDASTWDVCDRAVMSSVLAVTVREAARDTSCISSVSRCRAVRLIPEAVIQCDADPEDMILLYHTFLICIGCPL